MGGNNIQDTSLYYMIPFTLWRAQSHRRRRWGGGRCGGLSKGGLQGHSLEETVGDGVRVAASGPLRR